MSNKKAQKGAFTIEFSAVCIVFFAMVFGFISFGIMMTARMGFQHHSAEAARLSLQASHASWNQPAIRSALGNKIDTAIESSWVSGWAKGCDKEDLPDSDNDNWGNWEEEGFSSNYAYWRQETDPAPNRTPRYQIVVCLQANSSILLPPFNDASKVRGYTITTL